MHAHEALQYSAHCTIDRVLFISYFLAKNCGPFFYLKNTPLTRRKRDSCKQRTDEKEEVSPGVEAERQLPRARVRRMEHIHTHHRRAIYI